MAYTKPLIGALAPASESCGCNFFVNDSGQGVFIYTEGNPGPGHGGEINPNAIGENNVASVGDGSASVTPLANTGLPLTNPIFFGVPVGLYGVKANVGPKASSLDLAVNADGLAVSVFGNTVGL